MDRRSFLSGIGAFAAVLSLPHAGWALDWPTDAHPIYSWYIVNGIRRNLSSRLHGDFSHRGENSGEPIWFAINAVRDDVAGGWSEEHQTVLPSRRKGDPYTGHWYFASREAANIWSVGRAEAGFPSLAIVQSGTSIRPPKLFNGRYGSIIGSGVQAPLGCNDMPLRATWFEGQGL